MRSLFALSLFVGTACTSSSPAGSESYDSVRERLHAGPAQLFIAADGSTGQVTARRWTANGWVEGVTPVTIDRGELVAKLDAHGAFALDKLSVALAPIDIPEEVFKKPAQLHDVRISLAAPATAQATWTSDNDVTAQLTLALDLDWAVAVNGGRTPLATQHLPPITIDLMMTGDGDHVDASVALKAVGELWNWADLIQMTSLELSLAASTVD